jgi:PKD repeat protein
MNGCRILLALTTALIAVLFLMACGQTSQRRMPSSVLHPASINIADTLAQLDEMQAPDGVNPAVFAQLKDSLRAALLARGVDKIVSTPPTGPDNAVPDFAITDTGGGTADLTWHYYNKGDYNQDGTVGVSDITPLAMHFGEGWAIGQENTLPAVVDGSGDGTVNIADVTPIAMNFGVEAASYVIESCATEGGTYADVQSVPIADGLDKDANRMRFATNISFEPTLWYRVAPADSSLVHGIPSNAVQHAVPGSPVASIVPDLTTGYEPLTVSLDASGSTDSDGTIVKYEWDPEGDGIFSIDTGTTPNTSVTYTVAGEYHPAVRVTDNDTKTATASTTVTVTEPPQLPVANIVADINHGPAPLDVTLDASDSTDDGTIDKYEWDFEGDGVFELDSGTTSSVNYTYTSDGFYHPAVRVTDNDGGQDAAVTNVTVSFPTWSHTWGVNGSETACGIAEGPSGNLYVAGYTDAYKGGFWISTLVSKYTPEGNQVWVKSWDGDEDDIARDIFVDGSDNVYVVGTTVHTGLPDYDAFLFKLDTDGALQYQVNFGGGNAENAQALTVDSSGQAYVVGYTDSINTPGDMFFAKFNAIGAIMWQKNWSNFGYEAAQNVALDGLGNLFVVGSADSFGLGDMDAVLMKFDTDGTHIWERLWSSNLPDYGVDVAADSSGNVYMLAQTDAYGAGAADVVLLKYDTWGTMIWQQTWGTPGYDYPTRITLDSGSGDIYIAGNTGGVVTGTLNPFLLRFNSSGLLVSQMAWLHGSDSINASGLVLSSQNAPYLVGNAPDANVTWQAISGVTGISLGTPSTITGNLQSTSWLPAALSNVLADQVGIVDTGGGSTDLFILKENPLFW